MIEPVNTFSAARFGQLLVVGLRSGEFRLMAMAVTAMLVFMTFMVVLICCADRRYGWSNISDGFQSVYLICIAISPTVGASLFAAKLKERGDRISHIMLPATAGEKFLARFVVIILGAVVLALIMYLVLYMAMAAFGLALGKMVVADIQPFKFVYAEMGDILTIKKYGTLGFTLLWIFAKALYIFSAYLLGGILWKGKSWLITTFVLILLILLMALILPFDITYFLIALVVALAALQCYAAWRLFARIEAAGPKPGNLLRRKHLKSYGNENA